jgi:deoxyribose-phosphate aldolase
MRTQGATELDMVINIGRLKEGDYAYVLRDLDSVIGEAQRTQVPVKVILETGALSPSEIVDGCLLSVAAGATFVKTSTGFGPGGATVETVRLMKMAVGNAAQVKASGGVRSLAEAKAMLAVGASRIGTSSGVSIVAGEGAGAKGSY